MGAYGAYYVNVNYLRKFKGLRKLRARFKHYEMEEPQLYLGSFGYFNLLNKVQKFPVALIFPKTDDEVSPSSLHQVQHSFKVERLMYFCSKYKLAVHLTEFDQLDEIKGTIQEQPYVAVNLKYLKKKVTCYSLFSGRKFFDLSLPIDFHPNELRNR